MSQHVQRARRRLRRVLASGVAAALAVPIGLAGLAQPASGHSGHGGYSVLVFSKTAGFRHSSIDEGIAAIEQLGVDHDFDVTATEDATAFNDSNLAQYDAVVWLSTTGDVLNSTQQAAFENYIQSGGGYAGIHAASDTEYSWSWYGDLVGAYFDSHPSQQTATVKVEDPAHLSTSHLDPLWSRYDEWYNYQANPRGNVHVLASLDESSYSPGGGAMGSDHPIAWCHNYDGGRAWYTGLGHTEASYSEQAFLDHILGGIETAAGVSPANCSASQPGSFEKVTLDDNTSNPMELAVADDGRVFYIDRNGDVRLVRTDGSVTTTGTLDVYTGQEFGLLGIALDPNFATNGWIYLTYSPASGGAVDRVSRFTLNGETLDLASETLIIEYPTNRDECCHAGGALEFDSNGDLYIAVGDNTNPFSSDGYAPIDERSGREYWDAQRTAANSNDLRGSVLRITPQSGGGYTIPSGNMFAPGTADTKPEIYAMGFRNPFRIGIDPATDKLLVADYGPDAGSANPDRGPDGQVEWNIVDETGFYGWPYCVGNNTPYHDYDFATGTSGAEFDCDGGPVNDSPNNTGITQLPPAIEAEIWYGKSTQPFPEIGTGGAPMAGGVYRYDPNVDSDRQWPEYWDGKAIFGEWNQNKLYTFQVDDTVSNVVDINELLPDETFLRPMALQWGPDGALYMIEWGSGFGGNNSDSGVYRIDYAQGNRAPTARIDANPLTGPVPLEVTFDGSASSDPEGTPLTYEWDFDGDGTTDSTAATATHTYNTAGNYTAQLTVTDGDGLQHISNVEVTAGNTAPEITVTAPVNGGVFDFGETIAYEVSATDAEDGTIDCADIVIQPGLGHDDHAHGYEQYNGCSGTFPLPGDEGHTGANIFGVVTVTVTDSGVSGANPLTSQEIIVLQPKRRQAEHFDDTGRLSGSSSGGDPGVLTQATGDSLGGGDNIGWIEVDDWWSWDPVNLTGIDQITLRAASPNGGTAEIRTGSPDGPTVATINIAATGAWQTYDYFTGDVSGSTATDSGPLYFVNVSGQMNVNWVDYVGTGISEGEGGERSAFEQIEAENYDEQSGTQTESTSDTGGGQNVGWIDDGDWLAFHDVDFGSGAESVDMRVASNTSGGNIEVRLGGVSGTLVGTCTVPGTGGWQNWQTESCAVSGASGVHDVYLVFTGGSGALLNVNWFKFNEQPPPSSFEQIEAENYDAQSGTQTESTSDTGGGQNVGWINDGDWLAFNDVDLGSGADSVDMRVASDTSGGNIEVRLDGVSGTLVGTCTVPGTGGWQNWQTESCAVSGASGVHDVYLVFTGGSGYLFNVNWFKFASSGT